jgi:hypothetical protein
MKTMFRQQDAGGSLGLAAVISLRVLTRVVQADIRRKP